MQHEIQSKIQDLLQSRISKESEVVYLLIQLRKLDQSKLDEQKILLKNLEMFFDWVAHPELSKKAAGKDFLKRLNHVVKNFLLGEDSSPYSFLELNFINFRRDLNDYLLESNLDNSLCLYDHKWSEFIRLYTGVILDCPIIYKDYDLDVIEKITLAKPHNVVEYIGCQAFEWNIILRNPKNIRQELERYTRLNISVSGTKDNLYTGAHLIE